MHGNREIEIIEGLAKESRLDMAGLVVLLTTENAETVKYLQTQARAAADKIYGKEIYIRGLIEFTNFCRNNCYYCGIRRDNSNIERYRLLKEQILACCAYGYDIGMRTFVLQGGEDAFFTDRDICEIVSCIKKQYADCAVTLSIGEKSRESYQAYFDAGADRYLLRHETADREHYQKLHPIELSLENRKRCLWDLKEIGFQTGCGFMVGSPYQTIDTIWQDLQFICALQPQMVGIGPFIPQKDTPFGKYKAGTLDRTLRLLSIIRLLVPHVLLPATTALGTIHPSGREQGILCGANVVMPNLSPTEVREKYKLYDNKIHAGAEAAEGLQNLAENMEHIGYQIVVGRGDFR